MEENNNLTMERMAPPPSGGKCGSRDPRLGLHQKINGLTYRRPKLKYHRQVAEMFQLIDG